MDIDNFQDKLNRIIDSKVILLKSKMQEYSACFDDPMHIVDAYKSKLEMLTDKLFLGASVDKQEALLCNLISKLDALSPLKVLGRGYSLVTKEGKIIKESKEVVKGEIVSIKVSKGEFEAEVTKV